VIVYCTLLVGFNLLVDLLYGWLDPRITVYEQ
jgi:ABC-type dipeptide/oligopeptide/nickel transport system permease component